MRRSIVMIALMLLLLHSAIWADGSIDRLDVPRKGLGFAAGAISGIGLSYKQHLPNLFVPQVAFGVLKYENEFDINLGLALQRTFHATDLVRFYGITGLAFFWERNEWDEWVHDGYTSERVGKAKETDRRINTGIGIGIEVLLWKRIGIAVDGEYTVIFRSTDFSSPNPDAYYGDQTGDKTEVRFFPQVAAHYYF